MSFIIFIEKNRKKENFLSLKLAVYAKDICIINQI
jgi:hypothetical protein